MNYTKWLNNSKTERECVKNIKNLKINIIYFNYRNIMENDSIKRKKICNK